MGTQIKPLEWRSRVAPVSMDVTGRDIELLWLLARDLYATTANTLAAGFPSLGAAQLRLARLEKAGFIRSAKTVVPPKRRALIWALSDAGADFLRQQDPDRWTTWFEGWKSPADHPDQHKRSILHEIQRNSWCDRMERLFLDAEWFVDWMPGSAGHIRGFPGNGMKRVELTPDAVMMVNQNFWMIEYERSWRVSTLESKLQRYELMFKHRLWEMNFRSEPRVVFVLSEETTQNDTLIPWIQKFGGGLGVRGWFLSDQDALDDQLLVPGLYWDPLKHQMVRASWFRASEKAPRRAP